MVLSTHKHTNVTHVPHAKVTKPSHCRDTADTRGPSGLLSPSRGLWTKKVTESRPELVAQTLILLQYVGSGTLLGVGLVRYVDHTGFKLNTNTPNSEVVTEQRSREHGMRRP